MLPSTHHVLDARAGVARRHERFADENSVRAPLGVFKNIMSIRDARFGNRDNVLRDHVDDLLNGRAVHFQRLQIASVDANDRGTGLHRAQGFESRVRLHQCLHAERTSAFQQGHQHILLERGDDQQHEVGAVSTRLVDLIRSDDKILAQNRNVDGRAHSVKIRERTIEATLLGEDRDDRRSPGLVRRRESCRIRDRCERTLRRRGSLDLGDDLDGTVAVTQSTESILRLRDLGLHLLDPSQRDAVFTLFQVLTDPSDNVIENAHDAPLSGRNDQSSPRLAKNSRQRVSHPALRVRTRG